MLELCGGFVQNLGDALPEEIRELAPRVLLLTIVLVLTVYYRKRYHPVVRSLDLKYNPDPGVHPLSNVNVSKIHMESEFWHLKCISPFKKFTNGIINGVLSATIRGNRYSESLPALIEQGNGFSEVLKMQPIIQLQRVHQEVFSGCYGKPDVKPESFVTQIETIPTETSTRNTADLLNLVPTWPPMSKAERPGWLPLGEERIF
ncbi:Kinetochore-associated protein NSL1 [Manis javanica]|nr:Kinetochore-associated protein NSL1 [Manis javanica]